MTEERIREIVREEIAAANKEAALSQLPHKEFIQRLKDSETTYETYEQTRERLRMKPIPLIEKTLE